ncbi:MULTISPECIES: MBL fold metallo-hydrolase [unclassified Leucobacter]|uniref:MBL fold metallo-hydrolase n=1 Tax=unclassified Leucobacter TaxID=2621730 RepID=UPI00165D4836|nr:MULTISPECIES: MBL fold metallo-hydrolase [unclassified Leucobacter]MBC9936750.1 MBL fold metallo-hydrolase [Leucobacter sp. cx-87]
MTDSTLLFDLPTVTIRRAVVSEMENNVYLLTAKQTGTQVLIDAADDVPAIEALIADAAADADSEVEPELAIIATTHSHWDHIRALAELADAYDVPTAAGADDAPSIEDETGVSAECLLGHGDVLNVDGIVLTAVHLRGHTPGSIAYVLETPGEATIIFSGDSLFPGGVGNTQDDAERFTSLLKDVEDRLFAAYPDSTIVLTGHGGSTTLGAERPALPEWRERGW